MSSILTNNGAMIALQTLKGINANMAKTQSEISTGKSVANAKDNAAVWAISKVMESDVAGFKAISDSLNLGQSTVKVAQQASETVTDLLTQMKSKIVSSQESNVDRAKIQTDIKALRDQITSVVGAAQFNGLNLLSNVNTVAGSGSVNVLSSLDRSSTGVAASNVKVQKQDLGTSNQTFGSTSATTATYMTGTAGAITGGSTAGARTITVLNSAVAVGASYRITLSAAAGNATLGTGGGPATPTAGVYEYVARDGDTAADVARGLAAAINTGGAATVSMTTAANGSNTDLTFNFTAAGDGVTFALAAATGGTAGGGLRALNNIDVTTTNASGVNTGAASALSAIEGLIQTATNAAASFGSVAGRLETQSKFVSGLMDSLKSGIGTLVDADMEETSARLQALQVQQQLGVQSLSIANQAPQSILSLFRG